VTKIPLTYSVSYFNLGGLGASFGGLSLPKPPVATGLSLRPSAQIARRKKLQNHQLFIQVVNNNTDKRHYDLKATLSMRQFSTYPGTSPATCYLAKITNTNALRFMPFTTFGISLSRKLISNYQTPTYLKDILEISRHFVALMAFLICCLQRKCRFLQATFTRQRILTTKPGLILDWKAINQMSCGKRIANKTGERKCISEQALAD